MSSSVKIQFLAKMDKVNCLIAQLCTFLRDERLITPDMAANVLKYPPHAQAQEMYALLMRVAERLDLIDWEWVLLPQERMKLTLVTRNGVKEFSHHF